MPELPQIGIRFASEESANRLVAGIPAAARAVAMLSTRQAEPARILVSAPGEWKPSRYCIEELGRLAPDVQWEAVTSADWPSLEAVDGAMLQYPIADVIPEPSNAPELPIGSENELLERASKQLIKSTGKAADGIVSRHFNRPISQFISQIMLRFSWTRPGHATAIAGLIGLAMILALVWGGQTGLLIGAALFQCASIVDGVDGEMARVTFRTSDRGAMLDSVTDTITNLGFLAGVSFNVWQQGMKGAAAAGVLGVIVLAVGSAVLAIVARRSDGPFTFDALKHKFREKPSRLKQALTYITMRDFYALAACLAILAGAVQPLLYIFAFVACGWLSVVLFTFASSQFSQPKP